MTTLVLLAFFLGAVAGLRTMMAPALVCWGAHFGWLSLAHTPLAFLASPISLGIFSLLAIGELIGDKLPKTPSRLDVFPLIARSISGALSGAALAATAGATLAVGAVAGIAGALAGAFAGYSVRRALTARAGLPDLPVALLEDLVAIGGGLFIVSRF